MQYSFGKDVDFYPIHRSLVASTDDTTFSISPGGNSTHCKDNEMLVSSVHDNKTQTYYKKSCDDDDDENARVMRVEITFIFTGEVLQYTMYLSTARGSSLAVNDRTMDVRVTGDRPSTP